MSNWLNDTETQQIAIDRHVKSLGDHYVKYVNAHGFRATNDSYLDMLMVTVKMPYTIRLTEDSVESGSDDITCRNWADIRNALGY